MTALPARLPMIRLDLRPGQVADYAGRHMVLVGRARDRTRRLIFEDPDGIQRDFSDEEVLTLQAEGNLELLTAAEVEAEPHPAERPPITLDYCADPAMRAWLTAETMRKFAYVAGWEAAGCPSRTAMVVAPILDRIAVERDDSNPPSLRQFLRWIAQYLLAGCSIDGLVPQTLNRGNFDDRLDPDARSLLRKTVADHYLVDTRPTAVAVHEHVKAAFKEHNAPLPVSDRLKVPSLDAVHAEIALIDSYTKEFCRRGKRAADQRYRPVGTAPQVKRVNEAWEIDHTRVNCVVIHRMTGLAFGRPWVTVVIDRYSLLIVAIWISFEPPCVATVFHCLRAAILPKTGLLARWRVDGEWPAFGRPSVLIPDNGREFKATSFRVACARLGMDVQYCPVLKPWYKGTIERALQTLTRQVFERVPGTTFSNIFERSKETPPEQVAVATLDDLWFHALNWVVNTYNRRPHRVLGERPVDLWHASAAQGIRPPLDPVRIDRILTPVEFRHPQRTGVEYHGVHYNAPSLAELRIRPDAPPLVKLVINPNELGTIGYVDPADNAVKALVPQGRFRALMRGRTLEQHLLARAFQRANLAALAGENGLAKAQLILDETMRARSGANGEVNCRKAKAAWAQANRVLGPEDTELYTDPSVDDIAPEIFAVDGAADVTEPPGHPPCSGNAKSQKPRPDHASAVQPNTQAPLAQAPDEDALDLDAYLAELNRDSRAQGGAP